jgi:non-hemolytic enterotoxin B/C
MPAATKVDPTNVQPIKDMNSAVKGQSGQALILQTYALTVERQPLIDFGAETRLKEVQGNINGVLGRAKDHAKIYLAEIQPAAIGTITRVDRYFNMQVALTKLLKSGQDRATLLRTLRAIEEQSLSFKTEADDVARRLQVLRGSLSEDASEFERFRITLHEITDADGGLIKDLENQVKDIDGKMAGAIAAAVVSGVAVAGGIFLVCVGTIAGFVTAGTSTPLAVLGGTLIVGGVAGSVGAGIAIATLASQKNALLLRQSTLTSEVKFAQALDGTFTTLSNGAAGAAQAAQHMANAWNGLSGHLRNLADDLEAGRADQELLELYVTTAESDVNDIKGDVRIIKQQLAGAETVADPDASLADVVNNAQQLANDNAAARAA